MKVGVIVTQNHIKRGRRNNSNYCPIALALKETLGLKTVSVSDGVRFGGGYEGLRVRLPLKARKFIEAFDDKKLVKPFSFTL